jgi:hypothetical protein
MAIVASDVAWHLSRENTFAETRKLERRRMIGSTLRYRRCVKGSVGQVGGYIGARALASREIAFGDELFICFKDGVAGHRKVRGERPCGRQLFARPEPPREDALADRLGQATVRRPRAVVSDIEYNVQSGSTVATRTPCCG